MVSRSTLEWTCGGGENALGGRVNRLSTRANSYTVVEGNP